MKISDLYPSRYVKAEDLRGQPHEVTIARTAMEKMTYRQGIAPEPQLVVYFEGHEKGLVAGSGKAKLLARLFGDDTDMWVGKKVVIFPTTAFVSGENRPSVGIRAAS